MTNHRPTTTAVLLVCVAGATATGAADWRSGNTTYHPGANYPGSTYSGAAQSGTAYPGTAPQTAAPSYGLQPSYKDGTFRPREYGDSQWQGNAGGSTWSSGNVDQRGAPTWNRQPQGYLQGSGTGRPLTEYRFRQRPEDKASKSDDAPRYRPDPDLVRRSQQFWGVPGQDSPQYGGMPGAVFRPLRPDQETSSKPAAPAAPPSWPGNPAGYPPGYGYPY